MISNLLKSPVLRVDYADSYGPKTHMEDFYLYCKHVLDVHIPMSDFNPRFMVGKDCFLVTFPNTPEVLTFPAPPSGWLVSPTQRPPRDAHVEIHLEHLLHRLAVIARTYVPDDLIPEEHRCIWPTVSSDLSDKNKPFSELLIPVFQGLAAADFRIGTATLELREAKSIKGSDFSGNFNEYKELEFTDQVDQAFADDTELDEVETGLYRTRAKAHFRAIVETTGAIEAHKGSAMHVSEVISGEEVDRGLFYDRRIYTYVRHDYPGKDLEPMATRIEYRYRRLKARSSHLRAIYNSFC